MMATLQQCFAATLYSSEVGSRRADTDRYQRAGLIGIQFKPSSIGRFSSSAKSACCPRSRIPRASRIRCALLETERKTEKKTLLHDLHDKEGQSPWYDNLSRPVTDLIPLIESGIRGVTSNPTIFAKAISSSNEYDDQFRQLTAEGNGVESAYWGLVVKDIQDALDLFRPIYDESNGNDGYVSVEVSPGLAHDTEGTVNAAKSLHSAVNRPNVYIKIPATEDCLPSIKTVISLGISVNVTLIFSIPRYEDVIEAYLEGLEEAAATGLDLSKISSVASFFVSRVDTIVDKKLTAIGTEESLALRGKAANAQAGLAFKLYQEKFSGPRWEALAKQGAKKQRLLWASTGVKNPEYPDTHYISPLVGPDTVNTMPENAMYAFLDHGSVARTIDANLEEAKQVYDKVEELGIQWSDVGSLLEIEGVASFKKSFDDLIVSLVQKVSVL